MATYSIPAPPEVKEESEILIVQYVVDRDPIAEIFLPGFWKRLRDEGIFELFFHDHPDMNFGEFVKSLSQPNDLIFMIAKQFPDRLEHMGMATLSQVLDNKLTKRAVAGFLFFKDYWNHRDADAAGQKVVEMWLKELKLDTIAGLTPKLNRPALAYIHRLGFKSIGELPNFCTFKGKSTAAVLSYLTLELYEEKRCQQQ